MINHEKKGIPDMDNTENLGWVMYVSKEKRHKEFVKMSISI